MRVQIEHLLEAFGPTKDVNWCEVEVSLEREINWLDEPWDHRLEATTSSGDPRLLLEHQVILANCASFWTKKGDEDGRGARAEGRAGRTNHGLTFLKALFNKIERDKNSAH